MRIAYAIPLFALLLLPNCASAPARPVIYQSIQYKYDAQSKDYRMNVRYCAETSDNCYVENCETGKPESCTPVSGDSAIKKQYVEVNQSVETEAAEQTKALEKICKTEGRDRCVEEFGTRSARVKKLAHTLICSQTAVTCRKREIPGNTPTEEWDLLEENQTLLDRSADRITRKIKDQTTLTDVIILDEVIATNK